MPTWRPQWSLARTWFVTVRLLEVAGALLVVGQVLDGITAWRQVVAFGPAAADGTVVQLSFLQHVTAFAQTIVYRPVVLLALFTALVVVAGVFVLHRVRPVEHARLLRWELLVLGAAQLVVGLLGVVASVVSMFTANPFAPTPDPATVTVWTGPGPVEQGVVGLAPSGVSVLVLVVAALWWARLPAEFDEEDDTTSDVEFEALADEDRLGDERLVGRPGTPGADEPGVAVVGLVPDGDRGGAARQHDRKDAVRRTATPPARRSRRARSWRAGPAPDVDPIVLDGVEEIAPVERLTPREDGDGSTANGYESWLRRQ
jgi:hypothetical protein